MSNIIQTHSQAEDDCMHFADLFIALHHGTRYCIRGLTKIEVKGVDVYRKKNQNASSKTLILQMPFRFTIRYVKWPFFVSIT